MKFIIAQTEVFHVEAKTAQEAYDLFIQNESHHYAYTEEREIHDEDGQSYSVDE